MDIAEQEEGGLGYASDESDIGLDLYTPLERPTGTRVREIITNNVSNPLPEESDTDSDDDIPGGKRRKLSATSSQVPKNYCVWASNANDDIADILTSFGMDTPENDRNVENYPVPREKLSKVKGSRRRKIPAARTFNSLAPIPIPKKLDDVNVTYQSTFEEVAKEIAGKLGEPNFDLVLRIVVILGKAAAIEYFWKTRDIEAMGGLLIMNGSRRRTSGGVFIHLIRSDKQIPGSKLVEIFEDPTILSVKKTLSKMAKMKKRKRFKIRRELSNPPPSPECPSSPSDLPELPNRSDLIFSATMNFPDLP